jgi:hypothetical protein
MSLKDAIIMVAESMEEDAKSSELKTGLGLILKSYARELRTAVKADEREVKDSLPIAFDASQAGALHRIQIEKAKEEFRSKKEKQLEKESTVMMEIVGLEEEEGTIVQMPAEMPVGARTNLNGNIFVKGEDNKLHYEPQKEEAKNGSSLIIP